MEFSDVATFFDTEQAYDGYSGAALFLCQFSSFNDAASDGSTNRRRVLSTGASIAIPARRVVLLGSQRWVVGEALDDMFQNSVIRKNYSLRRATDSLAILTPAEACSAATGTPVYAQKYHYKDIEGGLSDNEYDPFWNVFMSETETVLAGSFLRAADGTLHRVRQFYHTPEGFLIAQSDQLDAGARVTGAVFSTGAYSAATDTFAAGSVTTNVLLVDPTSFYRWQLKAQADVQAGDKMVYVAASVFTPKMNQTFTLSGKTRKIVSFQAELDSYVMHTRLA